MENKANVTIGRGTLRAVMNLLTSTDGVDLTGIVDDLANSGRDRDVVGLNLALLFKGVKVPFEDTTPRMTGSVDWNADYNYRQGVHVLIFKSYSALTDEVRVMDYDVDYYSVHSSNDYRGQCSVSCVERTISPEEWANTNIPLDRAVGIAIDNFAVDKDGKWRVTEHTPVKESAE